MTLASLVLLVGLAHPHLVARHTSFDLAAVSSNKWDRARLSIKDADVGIHGLRLERPSHDTIIRANAYGPILKSMHERVGDIGADIIRNGAELIMIEDGKDNESVTVWFYIPTQRHQPAFEIKICAVRVPDVGDGYVVFTGAWPYKYSESSEKTFDRAVATATVLADPFR